MTPFHESDLEEAVLSTLSALGWQHIAGTVIAPGNRRLSAAAMARCCWLGGCGRRVLVVANQTG